MLDEKKISKVLLAYRNGAKIVGMGSCEIISVSEGTRNVVVKLQGMLYSPDLIEIRVPAK